MERFYDLVREECRAVERSRGVRFEFDTRIDTAPAGMDAGWTDRFCNAATRLDVPFERIPSGSYNFV